MYTPPPPSHQATSAASTLALAACCVNSFLISAYHFISTFQRKAQCERCHVHVQEERTASNSASKSRRGVRKCCVIVAQSGKRKKKKSANCNCLAANLRKCRIIADQGNQDCIKSEESARNIGVKLLKSELHVGSCCCGNWRSLGESPALLKRLISA